MTGYEQEVKPRLKGRSFLVRFADDFIIGCELESDAQRVMEVLPQTVWPLWPDHSSAQDKNWSSLANRPGMNHLSRRMHV